jgi:hypothetical protein
VFAKANTEPLAGSGRPCLGMRCPIKKNKKNLTFLKNFLPKNQNFSYMYCGNKNNYCVPMMQNIDILVK